MEFDVPYALTPQIMSRLGRLMHRHYLAPTFVTQDKLLECGQLSQKYPVLHLTILYVSIPPAYTNKTEMLN